MCAFAWVVVVGNAGPATAANEEERIPAIGGSTSPVDSCAASFPPDAFAKAASVGAVAPGQSVAVDVSWRPAWHPGERVDILGCVAANGRFVAGSRLTQGVENTGLHVHTFVVPANAANDILICEAAVIVGPGGSGAVEAERTDPDCFTVASAAEPAPAAASDPAKGQAAVNGPPAAAPVQQSTAASSGKPAAVPAPTRTAAAADPAPAATAPPAVPASSLPHTGARERALMVLAGTLLALGGCAVATGARRAPVPCAIPSALE
jgi:hypothetical protein